MPLICNSLLAQQKNNKTKNTHIRAAVTVCKTELKKIAAQALNGPAQHVSVNPCHYR